MNASAQISFDTSDESKLWLEGSSTVHSFDCVARSIEGTAYIEKFREEDQNSGEVVRMNTDDSLENSSNPEHRTKEQSENGTVRESERDYRYENEDSNRSGLYVHLKIPVESFDCGRSRMNRDMYDALKSDRYDYITFDFEHAKLVEENEADHDSLFAGGFRPYVIDGTLQVAGVAQYIKLITQGRSEGDGVYRVRGHKEISMHDFGVDPPSALGGLIRAHEELTVFFDLVVLEKPVDS